MVKSYRDFPENPQGQRYGSEADAATPQDAPDLISACGVDGRTGYVRRADLRGPEPRTPNEAIEITEAAIAAGPRLIPLWSADGIARIGSFLVNGLPGSMPS